MYPTVLFVHSWWRWGVILLGLVAVFRAIDGARTRRPWEPADDRSAKWFSIALDLQTLLGVVLYFLFSPITKAALSDFGGAMKVSAMRFWAIEHWLGMVVAIGLVHAGRARARRADGPRKHRIVATFFVLAMLAILASIPWPGTPNARPLFRW